jgi:cytochrome c oxidase cbb3-type subunit 3
MEWTQYILCGRLPGMTPGPRVAASISPLMSHPSVKWTFILLTAALFSTAYGIARAHLRREHLQARLLTAAPDALVKDGALMRYAVEQARPLYAANCARCHGVDMRGNTALGAPDLTDRVWLYGEGSVFDIERTLLYGIRSGRSKSHNVTDMPAFGSSGTLSASEVRSVVQYVLQLSGRPHRSDASEGRSLYDGKANCADCHGDAARGNSDYGAPDLTANVWNSGADPAALYTAIYFGQHHVMPGWIDTLSLEQIRALALYVYSSSHQTP